MTILTTVPIAHAPRVNSPDIPYIACDTKCTIYTSSHAIASSGEVKKLESVNDAKTGKQSVSAKSTQIMCLECHKEP